MMNAAATENAAPRHVANIIVAEAFDLQREHESAAQYHVIRVEPGTYRVELRISRFDGRLYLAAVFTGICTASGYGDRRYSEEEGKPSTVVRQPYKYELRAGNYPGRKGRVEIIDAAALDAARGV